MRTDPFESTAFDAYEAAGWEVRASAYAAFISPITSRLAPALLDAAAVAPGSRVVDVACGSGDITAACAARGASPVGIDISAQMVALAASRHPGIDVRQGDAHALPLPDASADALIGNFALPHLGRPDVALAEFVRVLAPGGTLALSTWDVPAVCRFVGVFVDAVAAVGASPPDGIPAGPSFFQFADEARLVALLENAGLRDVAVRTTGFTLSLSSADELWHGMLGGTVRTRDMVLGQPAGTQEAIRAEYDALVAGFATDGGLAMPVSVKIGVGRRPS